MSFKRAAGLFALAAVLFPVAVAMAGGAPRPTAVVEASAPDPLLRQGQLRRDMRAFALRARARRLRALMRAGVVPVRGPIDFGTATNRFGAGRSSHAHNGQDMFAPTGTPLVASRDGIVVEAGSDAARGNYLVLFSPAARQSYAYFHMAGRAAVKQGEKVLAGQRVGALGCSGSCDGAHLHFEVHPGRSAQGPGIDPMPLLRRWRHLPRA